MRRFAYQRLGASTSQGSWSGGIYDTVSDNHRHGEHTSEKRTEEALWASIKVSL